MQSYLGLEEPMVFFDILLHVGTVAAVVVVYRDDLWRMAVQSFDALKKGFRNLDQLPEARTVVMIVVANIPTAVMGLALEDYFERLFASPFSVGCFLIVTGIILFATRNSGKGEKRDSAMTVRDAVIIGIAQGFAITPGISRSGMTIAVALLLGIERASAARFSFLLSIPAILGAVVLKSRHIDQLDGDLAVYMSGAVVSFVVGIFALKWLIEWVRRGKLSWFSWYVWLVGAVAIVSYF